MSYRSPLSKARGAGSAKEGAKHWIHHRFSAVGMIFVTLWLLCFIISAARAEDFYAARELISQPFNAFMGVLFVFTAFYHSTLGLQVVIEDYVSCPKKKLLMLLLVKLGAIAAAGAGIFAILSIYFKG